MNVRLSKAALLRRLVIAPRRAYLLRGLLLFVVFACANAIPALARANECPNMSITAPSNQTYTFAVPACSPTGANAPGTAGIAQQPSHGSASVSANDADISYTNNGTGTSDFFSWYDDKGEVIGVTVTIGAVTPVVISPTSAPSGTLNQSYSLQFSATGGNGGPYTYVINSGVLPAGLSDNASGLISGTPTESGSFTFTETATDSANNVGEQTVTLVINGGTITVTPSSLPNATAYVAYSQPMSASGGTAPYTYAQVPGTAPPSGITIGSSGTISGTATALGTTNFSVEVTDAAGISTQMSYSLQVVAPTITITPSTLPNGDQGVTYPSQTLTANGGTAPYTYQITSGAPPGGMTLNASSGLFSGTPTASGTFTFTVVATDLHSFTSNSANYSITIAPPLTWTPTTPSSGTVGVPYNATLGAASGGASPYVYSINSGALPAGLSLNSATGAITGTPTAGGTFNPSFKVTDANGVTRTSGALTLTINAPTLTVTPASGALPNATQNTAYTQTLSTTGGTPTYTYQVTSGALPAGITLAGNTLSGTPTGYGNFSFQITATDSSTGTGPYSSNPVSYTLNVISSAPVITTSTLSSGTVGTAYAATIGVTGGAPSYTFQITSGALPAGLQLSSSGSISGTPTAGGTFPLTVQVTDANGKTGTQSYSLTINAASITVSPGSVTLTDGVAANQTLTASGGTASYTFSVTSGSLPAGLSLSSGGALTGTPTSTGAYSFTVQARDSSTGTGPYAGMQTYSGSVGAPTLNLQPGPNISAAYGQAYALTFTTTGGTAPYTYALSGTLPTGLSFNTSTATLSGVPAQSGTFNFSVTSTDHSTGSGAPFSVTQNYTLTVSAASISITPSSLPSGAAGTAYTSTTLSASGGISPYRYSLATGSSLPAGLTLSSSGTISGTPTSAGTYSFSVVATDQDNATGTQTYSLSIGAATITLTPSSPILPAATAEAAYNATFSSSGGTAPYHYAITAGALPPGISLSNAGSMSGTPTAAGTYNFTVQSTDSSTGTGAPFFTSRVYSLTVNAPSISINPSTLPGSQVAAAYSQQLTASGGDGSYTFSVSAGTLPTGLSLSTSGLLSGTPSAAGNYNFTVTAKDSLNFSGSQAYTITTQQPRPIAVNDAASTQANQAVTINVTSVDTGPITSIAMASSPAHGTATISGLSIVYTPTHNFFGADTLTYTATGPGGTSAPATVTITVTPLAVPTVAAQSATVLAGNTVSINPTAGATGGPFTAIAIVKAPSSGTATVSGNAINYSAETTASGQVTFTYTLANAFGVSLPATVTVTVDPRPIVASQSVSSVAGRSAQVNLTQGATGGPFTAATLVSLSPASAGNARIVQSSGGYQLDFTASPTFSGAAIVTFTLSNAYATSAPGTVTIDVTARPDPSKDPEVLGVLNAQADATREFAQGQIENFQQRLENLHGGGGGSDSGFQNNLTFVSGNGNNEFGPASQWPYNNDQNAAGNLNRRYLVNPQTPANPPTTSSSPLPDGFAIWTGGAVNFGSRDTTATANGFDFTTAGISMGIDRRMSASFAMGVGVGYGHDDTDIGHNGSRSTADSYNIAWYGSFSPTESTFIDGLISYQMLSFDARRYVTADGNTVDGSREGHQVFASLAAGYEYRNGKWLVSPYGRIDDASARLNRYTEQGDAIYALSYGNQMVRTTTASLGVRMNYLIKEDYGTVMPQLRLEYGHDFQGSSQATMTYADLLSGPIYRAQVDPLTQNHFMIGIGVNWQLVNQWLLRLEYQNQINAGDQNDQSILINVQKKF